MFVKNVADHWCKVTTTNSIHTQYGTTLDVPCKVTGTNTGTVVFNSHLSTM